MHMTYEVEMILLCSRCDVQCSVCHITDSWISLRMAPSPIGNVWCPAELRLRYKKLHEKFDSSEVFDMSNGNFWCFFFVFNFLGTYLLWEQGGKRRCWGRAMEIPCPGVKPGRFVTISCSRNGGRGGEETETVLLVGWFGDEGDGWYIFIYLYTCI